MRSAIYHHSVLVGLLLAGPVATAAPPPDSDAVLAEAWLEITDAADLRSAAPIGFTVAEGRTTSADGRVLQRIIASPRALRALSERGYAVEIARVDHRRGAPSDGYREPATGDLLLADLVDAADRAGLVRVGTTGEGRPIVGAWFGQPPDSGAPTLRVLGAHHGDEWSSFEVALDLAEWVSAEDGGDPDLTALLDDRTLWIVPYVNPDGIAEGSRYNAAGIDLNRNYGYEWSDDAWRAGDAPFSEPETRAIRAQAEFGAPFASLSLHSGETNIGYVWNYSRTATPEEAVIADLAEVYASECTAPDFWVTNGADWYTTTGDTNDWSYGRFGTMDFTVELTDRKTPETDQIGTFLDWHDDAVRAFLFAQTAVGGSIADASGNPIAARLVWHPEAGEPVSLVAHPVTGTFHRHTVQTGTLDVHAPGFVSQTVPVDASATIVLQPEDLATGRLAPRLATKGAMVEVDGSGIVLDRPGHEAVSVDVVNGLFEVPDLAPGFWHVLSSEGDHPFGLFIADDGPAGIDSHAVTGDTLTIRGAGFGVGTRAWAVFGRRSALVPVAVTSESDEVLVIDLSGVPVDANTDVVVLSNGTQLAVLGLEETPTDTGDPRVDTGDPDAILEKGGCSCATGGSAPWLLWLPLLLLWRRSR